MQAYEWKEGRKEGRKGGKIQSTSNTRQTSEHQNCQAGVEGLIFYLLQ